MELKEIIENLFCLVIFIVIFIPFFNLLLTFLPSIKIKRKRFKNKVDPIYKLERNYFDSFYEIRKYKIGFKNLSEYNNHWNWLIPFTGLFEIQQYVECPDILGKFELDEIENIDLSYEYEKRYNECISDHKKHLIKLDEKKEKLNNINKIFLENYE